MDIKRCQDIFKDVKNFSDKDIILLSDKSELVDISKTGKIRPWRKFKKLNERMSEVYSFIGDELCVEELDKQYFQKKATRLFFCGRELVFNEYLSRETKQNYKVLKHADFCRVRCCPMCQWRRALKIRHQMKEILNYFDRSGDYKYYFLTLTIQNCKPYELNDIIDLMMSAWDKLMRHRDIKKYVVGWSRTLEITVNLNENSDYFETFHPHFHCILAMKSGTDRKFNSIDFWCNHWKVACFGEGSVIADDYISIKGQDIRPIYPKNKKSSDNEFFGSFVASCLELVKYQTKYDDILNVSPDHALFAVQTIQLFDDVFHKRKLFSCGGEFLKIQRLLKLPDVENSDLIVVGDEDDYESDILLNELHYVWWSGYSCYFEK